MTRHRRCASLLIISLLACNSQQKAERPATAQPASMAWIGPQPGADVAAKNARNPYTSDRAAAAQGYQFFNRYNCAGCHGDHGGGGMGPSLRDSLWYFGGEESQIYASIYQGRDRGMPAWGTKLDADQIWKLVTYIKSMRTQSEPNPPH